MLSKFSRLQRFSSVFEYSKSYEEYQKLKAEEEIISQFLVLKDEETELDQEMNEKIQDLIYKISRLAKKLGSLREAPGDTALPEKFHSLYIKVCALLSRCYHSEYEYTELERTESADTLNLCFKNAVRALNHYIILKDYIKIRIDRELLNEIHFAYNIIRTHENMIQKVEIRSRTIGFDYEEEAYTLASKSREIDVTSMLLMYPFLIERFEFTEQGSMNRDFKEQCEKLSKNNPCQLSSILLNKTLLSFNMITRPASLLYRYFRPLIEMGDEIPQLFEYCSNKLKNCPLEKIDLGMVFCSNEIKDRIQTSLELLEVTDIQIFMKAGNKVQDLTHAIRFMNNYLTVYFSLLRSFTLKYDSLSDTILNRIEAEIKSTAELLARFEIQIEKFEKISIYVEEWINEAAMPFIQVCEYKLVQERIDEMRKLNVLQRKQDEKSIANQKELIQLQKQHEEKMLKIKLDIVERNKIRRSEKTNTNNITIIHPMHDEYREDEVLQVAQPEITYTEEEKLLLKIESEAALIETSMQPALKDMKSILKHRLEREAALSRNERDKIIALGQTITGNTLALHGLFNQYYATSKKLEPSKQYAANITKEFLQRKMAHAQQNLERILPHYQIIQDQCTVRFRIKCYEEGQLYLLSRPELAETIATMTEDQIIKYGQIQLKIKSGIKRQQFPHTRPNFFYENDLIQQQHDEMKNNATMINNCINNNYFKK